MKRPEIIEHMIAHIGTVGDAIARAEEYGLVKPDTNGTELTALGRKRDAMGHTARAKDRAARRSTSHKPGDYKRTRDGRTVLR